MPSNITPKVELRDPQVKTNLWLSLVLPLGELATRRNGSFRIDSNEELRASRLQELSDPLTALLGPEATLSALEDMGSSKLGMLQP